MLSPEKKNFLLKEIIDHGGLHKCDITKICDCNPDVLGTTYSDLRKSVKNVHQYWKKMPPAKFNQMLRKINSPHSLSSLDKEIESSSMNYTNDAIAAATFGSPFEGGANPAADNSAEYHKVINVDTEKPYHNDPFVIHFVEKVIYNDTQRGEYRIDLDDVDIRDVIEEKFVAQLVDSNKVRIEVPPCSRVRREEALNTTMTDCEKLFDVHEAKFEQEMEISRNKILKDKKAYLLDFGPDVMLSNDVHSKELTNGELKLFFTPSTSDYQLKDGDGNEITKFTTTHVRACFKVNTVENTQLRVKKTAVASNKDTLVAKLKGLKLKNEISG